MTTIDVDQIDREPHPEGVNRFAGNDPQTFSLVQALTPQKALATIAVVAGELDEICDFSMASNIEDFDIGRRRLFPPPAQAEKERSNS